MDRRSHRIESRQGHEPGNHRSTCHPERDRAYVGPEPGTGCSDPGPRTRNRDASTCDLRPGALKWDRTGHPSLTCGLNLETSSSARHRTAPIRTPGLNFWGERTSLCPTDKPQVSRPAAVDNRKFSPERRSGQRGREPVGKPGWTDAGRWARLDFQEETMGQTSAAAADVIGCGGCGHAGHC